MTELPAATAFTAEPMTGLALSSALVAMRDFLAGLLGTDGTPATALAGLGALVGRYETRSATGSVAMGDRGKWLGCSGTWVLALPAAASAGAGFGVVVANTGTGTITIDPADSETIDGKTTALLQTQRTALLVCTGSAWVTAALPGRAGDDNWGLGGTAIPIEGTDNLKDRALQSGLYAFNGTTVPGGPESVAYRYVLSVINGSTDGRRQFVCWRDNTAGAVLVWFGQQATNGTGAITWSRAILHANLLGSVSQSGGVPTGAVIERGSNANGDYVRLADGTLVCTWAMDSSASADVTWTFPAAFAATPRVIGGPRSTGPRIYTGNTVSTTSLTFSVWSTAAARTATATDLIAIGRWF